MKIAIDVMGSDLGPAEIIAGALRWSADEKQQVVLVGAPKLIEQELGRHDCSSQMIECVPAGEVIYMDESPVNAIRKKKDASIVVGIELLKNGKADALVSCGNTGAQMAAALFILGRIPGVERTPIAIPFPNIAGGLSILIDGGANVDCNAKQLAQFALLGYVYAKEVLQVPEPKVALLNNGTEAKKGNNACVGAYQLINDQGLVNFIGNVEGRDLLKGTCDVIVCDGFIGNIVLKTLEGTALMAAKLIAEDGKPVPRALAKLDYRSIGGAPLLGLNGISIVCHGSSNSEAVYNGLQSAKFCVENNIVEKQKLLLS
jgi:glycerol-3-phosphate acyltransferase PlsX